MKARAGLMQNILPSVRHFGRIGLLVFFTVLCMCVRSSMHILKVRDAAAHAFGGMQRQQRRQCNVSNCFVIIVCPLSPLVNLLCIQNDAIITDPKVGILIKSNLVGPQPTHFDNQDGCPRIDYNQPFCDPGLLHHPGPNLTETELFQDMYHGFSCLATAIAMPWITAEGRGFERSRDRLGYEGGTVTLSRARQKEMSRGMWQTMAEKQFRLLTNHMYEAMISCQRGLQRGKLVRTSGYVRVIGINSEYAHTNTEITILYSEKRAARPSLDRTPVSAGTGCLRRG